MQYKLESLLKRPAYRYVLIGGFVYLIELATIFASQAGGASPVLAVAISFWIGLVISFALQKLITFSDKRLHHKILIPQAVAFSLLVLFNFGFTVFVTKLLANTAPAVVCRTLALGITTIWNFHLYKTRVFKSDQEPVY